MPPTKFFNRDDSDIEMSMFRLHPSSLEGTILEPSQILICF